MSGPHCRQGETHLEKRTGPGQKNLNDKVRVQREVIEERYLVLIPNGNRAERKQKLISVTYGSFRGNKIKDTTIAVTINNTEERIYLPRAGRLPSRY